MSDQSIVEVTQADRDAAAIVTNCTHWLTPRDRESIIHGHSDSHPLAQAFARHRIAEREACAMVAEQRALAAEGLACESASRDDAAALRNYASHARQLAAAIQARS